MLRATSSLSRSVARSTPSMAAATPAFRRSFASQPLDAVRHYDVNVNNVPNLPLPPLADTMNRYLETLQPLLSPEDLQRNKKLVADFVGSSVGKELHEAVAKVQATKGMYPYHYFEEAWDDMYYGGRWPLMVHVNPFFCLSDEPNPAHQNQITRAAKYTASMVRWWRKVVEGRLEPDMEKGKVLDGHQYPLVFGTERVPHETRDLFIPHGEYSRHIIVVHRHQYYRVDVVAQDGSVVSEAALAKAFESIRGNKGVSAAEDVGLLTTGDRTHYAKARHEMIRVSPSVNGVSFKHLDSSLFVVVLEDYSSDSLEEKGKHNLHSKDGSNRYFDKHQLIVHADGALGMCLEHGCNDGLTWYRMLLEVWGDVHSDFKSGFSPLTTKECAELPYPVKRLDWDLVSSPKTEEHIAKSAAEARALVDDVDTSVMNFKDFGRDAIKSWKVSPDAAMQMAFQLTYARVNPTQGAPATYESCAMKSYFHGRTETIRSCTTEARDMVNVFEQSSNTQAKRDALSKACQKHVDVAAGAKACSGPNLGVDRHMLALRTAANAKGIEMPAVFTDPAFSKSNTWILSTSNVTTPFFDLFGFGAVSEKGYGIGYQTLPKSLPTCVTSFVSGQKKIPGDTSSKKFTETLGKTLREFNSLYKA